MFADDTNIFVEGETASRGGKRQTAYSSVKSFDSFLAKKP